MIQIDEDNAILKILDIDSNQVSTDLEQVIAGCEMYEDTNIGLLEHIYTSDICELVHEKGREISEDVDNELKEIEQLCNKYECAYWRLINII